MNTDAENDLLSQLKRENAQLKLRLFELEEKLQRSGGRSDSVQETTVLKLLRAKDERLESYASELEEKRDALQGTVDELERRNAQLSLWMSALRLYQEIFENEAAAFVGVNREGTIVLFNRSAPALVGEGLKAALHRPIELVDFKALDPSIPSLARSVLADRRPQSRSVVTAGRKVSTQVYPLGSAREPAGALVRISVAPS